jgi:hypothetical protein
LIFLVGEAAFLHAGIYGEEIGQRSLSSSTPINDRSLAQFHPGPTQPNDRLPNASHSKPIFPRTILHFIEFFILLSTFAVPQPLARSATIRLASPELTGFNGFK